VRDPLSDVKLVVLVVFGAVLQKSVNQLANLNNRTLLRQIFQPVERIITLKWVDQNINEHVYDFWLSQIFLVVLDGDAFAGVGICAFGLSREEYHFDQ